MIVVLELIQYYKTVQCKCKIAFYYNNEAKNTFDYCSFNLQYSENNTNQSHGLVNPYHVIDFLNLELK